MQNSVGNIKKNTQYTCKKYLPAITTLSSFNFIMSMSTMDTNELDFNYNR